MHPATNEDLNGRITAISDALAAFIRTCPQDQRNAFHMNLKQTHRADPTMPGYHPELAKIIQGTR